MVSLLPGGHKCVDPVHYFSARLLLPLDPRCCNHSQEAERESREREREPGESHPRCQGGHRCCRSAVAAQVGPPTAEGVLVGQDSSKASMAMGMSHRRKRPLWIGRRCEHGPSAPSEPVCCTYTYSPESPHSRRPVGLGGSTPWRGGEDLRAPVNSPRAVE